MEQTDYLLRQISKVTELLKELLADVLKLKDQDPIDRLTLIRKVLIENLNNDIDQIALLSGEKLIKLIDNKRISLEGQKYLAEILNISSELSNNSNKQELLMKSLIIYQSISNENKSDFSIELHSKMEAIRKQLNQIS